MAQKALRPCLHPSCGELTRDGYLISTESGVYFKSFYLLQESTTWYNKNSYGTVRN